MQFLQATKDKDKTAKKIWSECVDAINRRIRKIVSDASEKNKRDENNDTQ